MDSNLISYFTWIKSKNPTDHAAHCHTLIVGSPQIQPSVTAQRRAVLETRGHCVSRAQLDTALQLRRHLWRHSTYKVVLPRNHGLVYTYGDFHGGTPKWMVYTGEYMRILLKWFKMHDLGVPLFQETSIFGTISGVFNIERMGSSWFRMRLTYGFNWTMTVVHGVFNQLTVYLGGHHPLYLVQGYFSSILAVFQASTNPIPVSVSA